MPAILRLSTVLALFFLAALSPAGAEKDPPAAPPVAQRTPVLSSIFPQGSERGRTLEAVVQGQHLDSAREVIFHSEGISAEILESRFTQLRLRVKVSETAAFGPHYFRVVTPRGPSSMILFRVGDQPHLAEAEPNSTFDEAQAVAIPATLNGCLSQSGDFDFFRFRATAGETWVFDLRSGRMGSGLDPALILTDSEGRKLQHEEDVFIWDPFFTHTFVASGDYFAIIQPIRDRTAPTHCYQLDIRQSPHIQSVHPIAIPPGGQTEVTIHGDGFTESEGRLIFDTEGVEGRLIEARGTSARALITVASGTPDGALPFHIRTARGLSNQGSLRVSRDSLWDGKSPLQPGTAVRSIARYRQPERIPFRAASGQTLAFEVHSQRLGAPTDLLIRLLDGEGKVVAENDDGKIPGAAFNKDPLLVHKFESPGEYTLEIRNLVKTTGEDYPYELSVREARPEPVLLLGSDRLAVRAAEAAKLKVKLWRRDGFTGEVPVRLDGLPAGFSAEPATIPADSDEVEIPVRAVSASPGDWARVRIVTPLHSSPAWESIRIASGGGEGATFGRVSEVILAAARPASFSIEAQLNTVNLVKGGTVEVPVAIATAPEFPHSIHFTAENLPAGVTAEPATAQPGESTVRLLLRAAPDAPQGRISNLAILAEAGGHTHQAPQISLLVD